MLPDKPYNMPMPRSQMNSGADLDEGFPDISTATDLSSMAGGSMEQSEAGQGLDRAVRKIERK
jgi:hypothetical protein